MAEPKTKPTKASVAKFIAAVENDTRRADAKAIDKIMRDVTDEKAVMWGPSIIGYGTFATPTGPWPRIGFSPRKANLVLYVMSDTKKHAALLRKLGKHKTSVACLYINKLADVDEGVLRDLIQESWHRMNEKYA